MPHRDAPPFRRRSLHLSLPQTLLGKFLAVVLALTLGVAALAVSLVLLAIGAAIGLLVWLWFLWRVRGVRRQMSARAAAGASAAGGGWPPTGEAAWSPADGAARPPSGRVIDGEVLRAGDDDAPPARDRPGDEPDDGDGGGNAGGEIAGGRPPPLR